MKATTLEKANKVQENITKLTKQIDIGKAKLGSGSGLYIRGMMSMSALDIPKELQSEILINILKTLEVNLIKLQVEFYNITDESVYLEEKEARELKEVAAVNPYKTGEEEWIDCNDCNDWDNSMEDQICLKCNFEGGNGKIQLS